MKRNFLKHLLLGLMVCTVAATGCKKKNTRGGPGDDGNIGGVVGTDIYSDDILPGRFGDDVQFQAGQFEPVYFDYDSAQINPSERAKLEHVADELRNRPSGGLVVEGHCDERGSREYNLALGERRALAVRAYLVGLGVDGASIQTKSLGEEQPAAMGHDDEAWRLNRRAEFLVAY
jgi:peptidoglycan-associated lipoprotein